MADFQPVEDAVGVEINGNVGSIPFVNTFGRVTTGEFDQDLADAIAAYFIGAYEELEDQFSNQFHIDSIVCTDLRTETGAQFVTAGAPHLFTGNNEQNLLPFQTAAMISWGTGTRGRSYRGRTYLGGFTEENSNGRSMSNDMADAMALFRQAVLESGTIGVISRFHGVEEDGTPIPRDEAIITPYTSGVVHTTWRTQRRRALASD